MAVIAVVVISSVIVYCSMNYHDYTAENLAYKKGRLYDAGLSVINADNMVGRTYQFTLLKNIDDFINQAKTDKQTTIYYGIARSALDDNTFWYKVDNNHFVVLMEY